MRRVEQRGQERGLEERKAGKGKDEVWKDGERFGRGIAHVKDGVGREGKKRKQDGGTIGKKRDRSRSESGKEHKRRSEDGRESKE